MTEIFSLYILTNLSIPPNEGVDTREIFNGNGESQDLSILKDVFVGGT